MEVRNGALNDAFHKIEGLMNVFHHYHALAELNQLPLSKEGLINIFKICKDECHKCKDEILSAINTNNGDKK